MEGGDQHGNDNTVDFFGQSSKLGLDFYSQDEPSDFGHGVSRKRGYSDNDINLNSQAEEFPNLASYRDLLQTDVSGAQQGSGHRRGGNSGRGHGGGKSNRGGGNSGCGGGKSGHGSVPRPTAFAGAIDGTHVPVVVSADKLVQHVGRHGYSTQNVLAICDFDLRFTFAVAGWAGSVHDMRVFNYAIRKYRHKFPFPPLGMFYLVDSGYPNKKVYLAPYKGTKYHLLEYRQGPRPRGKKEIFNYTHSSLRNHIERAFGVLKMKWRILNQLPMYSQLKQSKIILSCMALHNFIRESAMADEDFESVEHDENYMAVDSSQAGRSGLNNHIGDEEQDMNAFQHCEQFDS